jgi:hypothetical protein
MNGLLKLVNKHYKLTDESGKVFTKSMELMMLGMVNTDILTNSPVFVSKLLFDLQNVAKIVYCDDDVPTFKFSVNVSVDDMFASTESYNSLLIQNIIDSVVKNGQDQMSIHSIRLEADIENRDICCYIRMSS